MIRINLLPEEYRRNERTSLKLFAAIVVAAILVCSTFGWFGYVYFGKLGELEMEHARVAKEKQNREQWARYHDALQSEKKDYEQRTKTIEDIRVNRMLWIPVFDQVIDTLSTEETDRHVAWFKNVKAEVGNEATFAATANVQGSELERVIALHEDIESAEFYQDVLVKSPPRGRLQLERKRVPPESMEFALGWTFKPAKDWRKNQKVQQR